MSRLAVAGASAMFVAARFAIAVAMAMLVAACGDDGPDNRPKAPFVTVSADLEFVALGRDIVFTATIVDEKGAPETDYILQWIHGPGQLPGVRATIGAGVETLTHTPNAIGERILYARVFPAGVDTTTNPPPPHNEVPITFTTWGGPATQVVLDNAEQDLLVGESRPFSWFVYAATGSPPPHEEHLYFPSHEIASARSLDESIVTVDRNWVTAVAPGDAVVRVEVGTVFADLTVHVTAGVLGPPVDGATPIDGGSPTALSTQGFSPASGPSGNAGPDSGDILHDDHLIVDSRSYPGMLMRAGVDKVNPGAAFDRFVYIEWTGSQFGATVLNLPWERVWDGKLAIDETGRIWITYLRMNRDMKLLVVLDRAPGERVFRRHEIDMRTLPDNELIRSDSVYRGSDRYNAASLNELAIRGAPGGGVWMFYQRQGPLTSTIEGLPSYWDERGLVRISSEGTISRETIDLLIVVDNLLVSGWYWESPLWRPRIVADGAQPRILGRLVGLRDGGFLKGISARDVRKIDGVWVDAELPFPTVSSLPDLAIMEPADHVPQTGITDLQHDGLGYYAPPDEGPFGPSLQDYIAFGTERNAWYGAMDSTYDLVLKRARYDEFEIENPVRSEIDDAFPSWLANLDWSSATPAWLPDQKTMQVAGIHVRDDVLWGLVTYQDSTWHVARTHLPRPARTTDPDVEGRLLGRTALYSTTYVETPVIDLVWDGTHRWMLRRRDSSPNYKFDVFRGTAEAPVTLLNNDLVDPRRLVLDPSGTVVVLGIDEGRATLRKWTGSAWGLPIDVGPASAVYDVELLPGGAAFVALDVTQFSRGHVLHSPDAFGGSAFVDLGGFDQTLTHAAFGAWGEEPAIELLVDGTQVIALSHVQQLPNFGHEIWTRRWTSTATPISDIRTEDDAVAVLPRSAVVVNGVISTLAFVPADQTVAYLRSSDGFATKTTELWNTTTPDQTSLVVLADGRLAAVTCDRTSADIFQVHVRTSANGTSWSAPTPVRPAGGRGQRAYAATATATGLLVVMGDNNALRAYRVGAAGSEWGNRPTEALAITLTP